MGKTRKRYIQRWAPRIGEEAARYAFQRLQARLIVALSAFIFIFFLLPVMYEKRSATLTIMIVGGEAAAWLGGMIIAVMAEKRFHAALSQRFGIAVSSRNEPPLKTVESYNQWCFKNGLRPSS